MTIDPNLLGVRHTKFRVYYTSKLNVDWKVGEFQAALLQFDLDEAIVSATYNVSRIVSGSEHDLLIFTKPAPSPLSPESLKHQLAPSLQGNYDRLKRTRLALEAPSKTAEPELHDKIQADPDEKIFVERPKPDPHIAPIGLLYSYFGEFQDIYGGAPLPSDMESKIDFHNMEEKVRAFAVAMSGNYTGELHRRDIGNKCLNAIFTSQVNAADIGRVRSDGHSLAAGVVGTIVQYKNELINIKASPDAQCVGYVTHSHTWQDALKGQCDNWRVPALGITIIGDWIQFHAIILLGHQYRSVGLTSPISCGLSATNDFERQQLHKASTAAYILQQRIHQDIQSYLNGYVPLPPPSVPGEYFFPAVTRIQETGSDDADKYIQFKILDYCAGSGKELYRSRHLYHAEVIQTDHAHQSKEILVKFSQSYSIDLHNFCHEKGHAPKVLGFEPLPGGWFAIAMEYLPDVESIDSSLAPDRRIELEGLVASFHERGLVHGDLRAGNILYNGDNFWLIDFDWGGKAGEVQYPTWLLNEELLSGRQAKDLKIRKEDDIRVLRATLKNLRSPT